jgi:TolB-like protein
VLPFANLSPHPENEHLCDGLSEEQINGLTKVPPLRVVAHTSSFAFKGRNVDAREIGRALDVSAILEGSVRRAGSRLRVSAQLIDAASGYHLWSDQYDRGVGDIFAIQEEIAQAILRALRIELLEAHHAPVVRPLTASLAAHELYLQGRSYWHRRYAGFMQRAIPEDRAVREDPGGDAPGSICARVSALQPESAGGDDRRMAASAHAARTACCDTRTTVTSRA